MSNRSNPFSELVHWLAATTLFPVSRLEPGAERLLCFAACAAAEENGAATAAGPMQSGRDSAQTAALRAHQLRRSHTHYRSDNSAKV